MLKIFTAFVAFLQVATSAVAHSSDTLVSVSIRQTVDFRNIDCNSTCGAFVAVKKQCSVPHCGCNNKYLQTQGDCLLCQASSPQGAASVQFILDAEINQCHEEGIPIEFKLGLPPDAQAIVDKFDRRSDNLRRHQKAFLALQIAGGHVGLIIVLAFALFSRKAHRDATVLNFCITWIFSSIVYSILLYRGTKGNTFANTLGLLWLGLRAAIYGVPQGKKRRQFVTYLLLLSPYFLFLTFSILSVFIGVTNIENSSLQRARPANFYCIIIGNSFVRAIYGVTLTILLITVLFDFLIIMILYRQWRAFRHTRAAAAVPLSILLRVICFSIFRVAVAVDYGTVLAVPDGDPSFLSGDALLASFNTPLWVDMLQATIPSVGFLAFGINSEILSSLMFWRKKPTSIVPSISTAGTNSSAVEMNAKSIVIVDKANLEADTSHLTSNV